MIKPIETMLDYYHLKHSHVKIIYMNSSEIFKIRESGLPDN